MKVYKSPFSILVKLFMDSLRDVNCNTKKSINKGVSTGPFVRDWGTKVPRRSTDYYLNTGLAKCLEYEWIKLQALL